MKKNNRRTISVEHDTFSCSSLYDVVEINGKLYIPLYTTPDPLYTDYSLEYETVEEPYSDYRYGSYTIVANRLEDDQEYETRIKAEKIERSKKKEAKKRLEEITKEKELKELDRLKKKYEN